MVSNMVISYLSLFAFQHSNTVVCAKGPNLPIQEFGQYEQQSI